MRLARRMSFVRGLYWPLSIALMSVVAVTALALGVAGGVAFLLVGGSAVAFHLAWRPLALRWMQRLMTTHHAQLEAARAVEDATAVHVWLDEVEEYFRDFRPKDTRYLDRARLYALMYEERWAEALAAMSARDRDSLPEAQRALHDNNRAWCMAQTGQAAAAVTIAESAVAGAPSAHLAYCQGTLGVALLLDHRPADAVRALEQSIALGGKPASQACRSYYLGEAFAALRRLDEARAAWERAAALAPHSRWARRASERLAAPPPSAYR